MEEQALVIALVGVLGIGAQWLAWRTGWPAIVLMLAAGFLVGPVFGIMNPEHAFGELLEPMVAIGVALILFEGGLSLDFRELRHSGEAVWRIATIGVVIGWATGAAAGAGAAGTAEGERLPKAIYSLVDRSYLPSSFLMKDFCCATTARPVSREAR